MEALSPAGSPVDDGPKFDLSDEPQRKVVEWRERQLERLGVKLYDARILAVRRDVDLAQCQLMLKQGCTITQLKEIVL